MPFNPQATYVGGQLIGQGISQAGQSISEALQRYEEDKAKAGMADTIMDFAKTVPGAVSSEALQRYHQANAKERSYIAMGAQSNLASMLSNQVRQAQERELTARTNLYTAQAAGEGQPFEPRTTVVRDPVTGKYHTFVGTSKGQVQQLAPDASYAGQIEYDEQGNPIGKYDPKGRFIRFPAPPDPLKEATARIMEGTAPQGGATPAPTPAPPQAPTAPVRVRSVAEAMALPPGTEFIDPQGIRRRVPSR